MVTPVFSVSMAMPSLPIHAAPKHPIHLPRPYPIICYIPQRSHTCMIECC